ncbi:MAG: fructose-bisphosphatase class I, partial [Saprospiraceae bacterium]
MNKKIVTLDEFIIRRQKEHDDATGSLSRLLRDIGIASKIINREVNKAGLVNILGVEGSENSTGDTVQK